MALDDEIAYLSISELGALLRRRELSPTQLLDATLRRIARRNPSINSVVYVNKDDARRQAIAAEARLLAGDAASPLLGIPTAIKDLGDSRPGWRGTFGGIPALKDNVIDSYCQYSAGMERAGAVAIGKTNSPSFGYRGTCDNYLFGPSRNPFDTSKNTGGSSGGSAAAVADGLLPFSEGSDGGGSIRIPAAWTNLYGFKGSHGSLPRLSGPSAFGVSTLFTFEGCVTRSVEDTAFVLDAMRGHGGSDPYHLERETDYIAALRGSVRGKRIAYSPDFGVFPVDARVKALCAEAARAFEAAGAIVEEVDIEIKQTALALGDLWCRLHAPNSVANIARLSAAGHDLLNRDARELAPELIDCIEAGQRYTIVDLARDGLLRTELFNAVQKVFESYDLLLTPTLACPPVDNASDGNTLGPAEINGEPLNQLIGWCLTFFLNLTGHPAASVPAGLIEGKWPAGLQIVGRRWADADVIAASAAYEQVRPWRQHYALCAARQIPG